MPRLSYQYIPHIVTTLFVLIMSILVIYLIKVVLRKKGKDRKFDKQLQFTLDPELDQEEKESFLSRKLKSLPNSMIKAGFVEQTRSVEDLQRKMLLIGALIFTITLFFSRNLVAGFIPVFLVYGGVKILAVFKIGKTKNLMEEQIPGFVSTFKANIQANQHAQNAMIRAIDNTASPLYDELAYAKAIMEAGDFKPGIIALRKSTDNETLRQMASCIELASASGSNIEEQIEIIEEIIEDKQKIERKKRLGVNENKPLFIIAALFVPISFIGSYFMSEMYREFWFNSLLSWAIIIGIIIAMTISTYATWKIIQKIETS